MPTRYPIVDLPIFLGLNLQDSPQRLKEGELVLCTNMLPLSDYSVERIAGYTDKLTSDLGTTLTLSAYEHELWDGTKAVFFVYGTGLYTFDTGEATATLIKSGLTQDSKMRYVSYGNYVWCGNGFEANMVITPYYIHKINRAVISVTPATPITLQHVKDWYNVIAPDYDAHVVNSTEHVVTGIISTDFVPELTADNAPSPYVVSSDSIFAAGLETYKAMNDNPGVESLWLSNETMPHWWKIDMGSSRTVTSYSIYTSTGGSRNTQSMKTWKLYGSANDTDWTELDSRDLQQALGWNSYTVQTPGSYRYYKFICTANYNAENYTAIEELRFYDMESSATLTDPSLAGGDSQATTNTALNDLKAKFNTHRTTTGMHNVADSYHIISAADASSEATSITLIQDIYYNYIGHTGTGRVLPWGVTAPASAMTAAKATGSGLEIGVYLYVLTYVDKVNGWESGPSPSVSVTTTTGDQKVNLTAIPISTQANVTHKRIYRTLVGGASYWRVTEIANNVTVYTYDTTPDTSLGAQITTEGNAITPSCSQFFLQNDRIYMAGNLTYPAFLYWTETSNPHLYIDADNYKGYEVGVTGIGGLPTGLLVFEYHRTWYEAGVSPSTWSTIELSRDIGCVSHDSITPIEGTLVYEDAYGRQVLTQPTVWMSPLGAYATTGGEPFTISYKINRELVTKNLSSAVIIHDPAQNHVYFIVASS